ncbi:MAG: CoA-acylating methylmalonate-semialdehyde dehydrogenase [Yaniella sp.]|uniref:CoA-acylating methylmalonate-semialdehyde dehydrogenase n=2 Tax=Yaniella sp. TaxID=2773929 RepID=UPI002649A705|nr:CoA-acylating methylmalonate-semialdehyde dehydrogenase [Yaniella sp.]MDN5730783.1 CoA-acylating methylmalonate-semialdehyde dehydrogenase [Yaniella sp.]MDN5815277.1 CoA-acylating methylmalonate-semialdehyde dehydrogenase [Yaniella sp.]MDN5837663.1 CoA-acylating methylmalonate-semialdehyde dehydrogenase [Yaniella sp.]MDN5888580.1 CoA-acylating methylmalonate-semialdehyde dehydrogenase [Yaniella sp.]MDN5911528.1 CoA-acylating methylmalonate-semialdehyde dehydrogenase [Yaniella sp.]
MTQTLTHFINGAAVEGTSGRLADVYHPAVGEVAAQVPLASVEEVNNAVGIAAKAQLGWEALNAQRRARILGRFVDLCHDNMDDLATALSNEHGKTFDDAKGDVQRGLEVIEFCMGAPHLLKGEFSDESGRGIDTYSMRQALGVCVGISPFNFPAMIPLWQAGPALAAGNAFILKPSERDPSVPLMLAELFKQAGMPDGVFQVINGDKAAVDALLDHPEVQSVGFVGSTPIAQSIYTTAAVNGKRAQCFGGAKNHAIIMPDADLDQAADALIGAAFGAAGERCMALSVAVPVGQETADALVAKVLEKAKKLKVGPSLDSSSDFGPVVTAEAKQRIEAAIAAGVEEGAELVLDGRGVTVDGHEKGFYVGATIFDKATKDMSVYLDEIFGPVLTIVRADDFEEALALPTEHQYGNGVAIFTRDGDSAREFTRRVNVGMVGVNVPIPVPIAYYTFGGWKASGFGDLNQHGADAFKFVTKTKTVTSRWPSGVKEEASFVMPLQ